MKAAIVTSPGMKPRYGEFQSPVRREWSRSHHRHCGSFDQSDKRPSLRLALQRRQPVSLCSGRGRRGHPRRRPPRVLRHARSSLRSDGGADPCRPAPHHHLARQPRRCGRGRPGKPRHVLLRRAGRARPLPGRRDCPHQRCNRRCRVSSPFRSRNNLEQER